MISNRHVSGGVGLDLATWHGLGRALWKPGEVVDGLTEYLDVIGGVIESHGDFYLLRFLLVQSLW